MKHTTIYAAIAALTVFAVNVQAVVPDVTEIATNAEALFETVAGITVAIVGFYMLIRLVKKIRG